jgi:hypothetical protein
MPEKPKDTPPTWEASAATVTPRGTPVFILGREWPPGEWQPVSQDEKAVLEANYNVLTIREANTNG